MIARMNVKFDKEALEKSQKVKIDANNDLRESETVESPAIFVENTIRNSIQSAKLGALSVDPTYLHFRSLERKFDPLCFGL